MLICKRKVKGSSKKVLYFALHHRHYSITIIREFDFTRYKETNKVCMYKNTNDKGSITKTKSAYCKYPLYSVKVAIFHPAYREEIGYFTKMKYNGKFFSFMNHLQDSTRYLMYVYHNNESKLTRKLLDENKRKRILKGEFIRVKRVGYRLLYENGSGIFNFLYGNLDNFLKVLHKYDLRTILNVIRSDYYKLMESRK